MSGYFIAGILFIIIGLWIAFEIWRAPLLKQKVDGNYKIIKARKNFSDLFKKKQ